MSDSNITESNNIPQNGIELTPQAREVILNSVRGAKKLSPEQQEDMFKTAQNACDKIAENKKFESATSFRSDFNNLVAPLLCAGYVKGINNNYIGSGDRASIDNTVNKIEDLINSGLEQESDSRVMNSRKFTAALNRAQVHVSGMLSKGIYDIGLEIKKTESSKESSEQAVNTDIPIENLIPESLDQKEDVVSNAKTPTALSAKDSKTKPIQPEELMEGNQFEDILTGRSNRGSRNSSSTQNQSPEFPAQDEIDISHKIPGIKEVSPLSAKESQVAPSMNAQELEEEPGKVTEVRNLLTGQATRRSRDSSPIDPESPEFPSPIRRASSINIDQIFDDQKQQPDMQDMLTGRSSRSSRASSPIDLESSEFPLPPQDDMSLKTPEVKEVESRLAKQSQSSPSMNAQELQEEVSENISQNDKPKGTGVRDLLTGQAIRSRSSSPVQPESHEFHEPPSSKRSSSINIDIDQVVDDKKPEPQMQDMLTGRATRSRNSSPIDPESPEFPSPVRRSSSINIDIDQVVDDKKPEPQMQDMLTGRATRSRNSSPVNAQSSEFPSPTRRASNVDIGDIILEPSPGKEVKGSWTQKVLSSRSISRPSELEETESKSVASSNVLQENIPQNGAPTNSPENPDGVKLTDLVNTRGGSQR